MTIIRDPQGHGAIEGGFRAALTIYRADTRLNRRRCLFSYEVFAIRRRMKTPANTNKRTSERVSEQARCALVESERRLNRLPVHFCLWAGLPREEGHPSVPTSHTYIHTHTHTQEPCRMPSDTPPPPNPTYSLPSTLLLSYPSLNTSRLPSIHIAASATLCARDRLRLLSFSLLSFVSRSHRFPLPPPSPPPSPFSLLLTACVSFSFLLSYETTTFSRLSFVDSLPFSNILPFLFFPDAPRLPENSA